MNNKLACNVLNSYYQKHMNKGISKPEYFITSFCSGGRSSFTATCKFNNHEEKATAYSKQEAKRLSACLMLMYLNKENLSTLSNASMEITSPIEDEGELEQKQHDALNTYLKQRSIDTPLFNQLFIQELTNNLKSHLNDTDAFKKVNSPKSETLKNLLKDYNQLLPSENTPPLFELILKEMSLKYFCEFLETKTLDCNILLIKISFNLIAVMGKGKTPSEAIFNACLEAIKLLCVFNL